MRPKLPGAHRIVRAVTAGVCVHWYAWRGKGAPKIGEYAAATEAEADALATADLATLAAGYSDARGKSGAGPIKNFRDLAKAYEASGEFKRLAPSTSGEWSRKIAGLKAEFGDLSLRAIQARGARAMFLAWRDTMAETPRKADYFMQVLARILSWAVDREHIKTNAVASVEKLHSADRAEVVFTAGEIERLCAAGTPELAFALRFIWLTGFRRGDAIRVTWTAIDEVQGAIVWRPGKSRRRKAKHVAELTPQLRALLREIPRRAATILTSSRGRPWTGDGLGASYAQARETAEIEPGPDGKAKRLHDLRGTSATEKVAAMLEREELRESHGWSKGEGGAARAYVDAATVIAIKNRQGKE